MNFPIDNSLTQRIIGLAMRVHTRLGPGLLESAYERCLCHEFDRNAARLCAAGRSAIGL